MCDTNTQTYFQSALEMEWSRQKIVSYVFLDVIFIVHLISYKKLNL